MPRGTPNTPRSNTPRTDSRHYESAGSFAAPLDGALELPGDESIVLADQVGADYADALAFMEEPVCIRVLESSDPNAEPMPYVAVNGRNQYFVRGSEQWVKRKFVEVLARAKGERISTRVEERNSENPTNKILRKRAHTYPFELVEDKNPQGRKWLQGILNEDALVQA